MKMDLPKYWKVGDRSRTAETLEDSEGLKTYATEAMCRGCRV